MSRFGAHAYEGDRAFYVVQTDAWVERRLDGDTLTVDVVAHSAVLKRLGIEPAGFADRSRVDPYAVRLLRVVSAVDPALYARVPETTIVFAAPSGGPADKVVAALNAEADWPVIYAPPPAPRDVATEHPQGAG
ncbi:hypothetical protein [Actinomadura sp. HBU206391]|uniref:hypothetical protein n=1 Tax=Actinomadura sp. HBU206391 TaxID=2731692 RepID=UPI001650218D|nr:hypothetical protein [Actinomadura sp. HBU206391]MBC6463286.1 hypothetical protein [Actinomadura sp. HBU206391]